MADYIIAGTTYSGSPTNTSNPQRPDMDAVRTVEKIGRLIRAADGSTSWVHRGFKRMWKIGWTKANQTTQTAVQTLYLTTTTFSFTDITGASYTVLTAGEDEYDEGISTNRANAYLYNLTLVLREA
jgi:hypothetical protein